MKIEQEKRKSGGLESREILLALEGAGVFCNYTPATKAPTFKTVQLVLVSCSLKSNACLFSPLLGSSCLDEEEN